MKLQQKLQDHWSGGSFPECIREIYASTPDCDRAMRLLVAHICELCNKAIFKDLIHEGGDFAVECFECIFEDMASGGAWQRFGSF